MRRKISSLAFFVISALTFIIMSSLCYASSLSDLNINGTYTVTGGAVNQAESQTFILRAIGNSPMPDGSENGIKKTDASPGEDFNFGEIYFVSPGIYEYTVSREIAEKDDIVPDRSVYRIRVNIMSDGTAGLVYQKEGEKGKPDGISYMDKYLNTDYQEPENKTPPKTGDSTKIIKYIVVLIMAVIIYIICHFLLFRHHKC